MPGYAVGAANGYIYVRAEYPMSVSRLRHAIAEMENRNLLGDNILGTDFCSSCISTRTGALYVEREVALTASIEGKRGMPRVKPPRTVEKRTVGETDRPQQRRNVCQRTEDHSAGSRLVSFDRNSRKPWNQNILPDRCD